jgi:hypothetical protein
VEGIWWPIGYGSEAGAPNLMRWMTRSSGAPSTVQHLNYRNDLNPARSSFTKSVGCSQAAKCPPLSSLL